MGTNEDLAAIGYDRGGWHTSPADERIHLTSQPPGAGQHTHQHLDPGDPVRMLGRAAIGLHLGGPRN